MYNRASKAGGTRELIRSQFDFRLFGQPSLYGRMQFAMTQNWAAAAAWEEIRRSDITDISGPATSSSVCKRGLEGHQTDRSGQAIIRNGLASPFIELGWAEGQNEIRLKIWGSLTLHLLLSPQSVLATFQSFQTVTQLMRVILFYICQAISVDWQEKADRAVIFRRSIHSLII